MDDVVVERDIAAVAVVVVGGVVESIGDGSSDGLKWMVRSCGGWAAFVTQSQPSPLAPDCAVVGQGNWLVMQSCYS